MERTIEEHLWSEQAHEKKEIRGLKIQRAMENIALASCEAKILHTLSEIEEKNVSNTVNFDFLYPVLDDMTLLDTKINDIQGEIRALERDRTSERVRGTSLYRGLESVR